MSCPFSGSASGPGGGASHPLVRFIQLVPGGRPPQRADRSVGGTVAARGHQYCEALAAASAYGYYVFLARRLRLLFDGTEMFVNLDDMGDDYVPLRDVAYPGFDETFDAHAPEAAKGFQPTFLGASVLPGVLQMWPGCVARTAPGWSLLVRPVVNLARPTGHEIYEGIIETDRWFGPLFTNVRLTRTGVPIELDDDVPFFHVQPVRKDDYSDKHLADYVVDPDIGAMTDADWEAFQQTVVKPNTDPDRRLGIYRSKVRKEEAKRRRA